MNTYMRTTPRTAAITALILPLGLLMRLPISELYAADAFTRVSQGRIVSDVGNSRGAAWGDYNKDGFIDIFIPNIGPGGSGSANHFLYRNNTDGTFTRVDTGPVGSLRSQGRGAAWGDYDNDGFLDLVLVNEGEPNHLFHNNGDGTLA